MYDVYFTRDFDRKNVPRFIIIFYSKKKKGYWIYIFGKKNGYKFFLTYNKLTKNFFIL